MNVDVDPTIMEWIVVRNTVSTIVITMDNVNMDSVSVMEVILVETVHCRHVLMSVVVMGSVRKGSVFVIQDTKGMIVVLRHVLINAMVMVIVIWIINVNVNIPMLGLVVPIKTVPTNAIIMESVYKVNVNVYKVILV